MSESESAILEHKELTSQILKCFYDVYNELGYGFLESVYENALAIALSQAGVRAVQQAPIKVHFRRAIVGEFRADVLVEEKVILELKSGRAIDDVHMAQTLNYLKATGIHVGLILNFGPKPEFKRLFLNKRLDPSNP
jgi:GxxExxY protein